MPNGRSYLNSLDRSISNLGVSDQILSLPCFIEIPVFIANSVDPDQTPRSDLSLHCLYMPLLRDARHKWVKSPPRFTVCTAVNRFKSPNSSQDSYYIRSYWLLMLIPVNIHSQSDWLKSVTS